MANLEHLEILKQGVEVWNQWREENSNVRPNLVEADLTGLNLDKVNLSRSDLSKSDISGVTIREANLYRSDLNKAKLQRTTFEYSDLSRAQLQGTDLRHAVLVGATLKRANCRKADFRNAIIGWKRVRHSTLSTLSQLYAEEAGMVNVIRVAYGATDFSNADLSLADFRQAILNGAFFYESNMQKANLSGAMLHWVDLRKAQLSEAILGSYSSGRYSVGIRYENGQSLDVDIGKEETRAADLRQADLSEANLQEANLIETDLRGVICLDANLKMADMSRANLQQALLQNSNLSDANLSGANLMQADLSGEVNLKNSSLRDADLSYTDLCGAVLANADLTGAHLIGTNFEKADLSGCRIYGISAWRLKLKDAVQSNLIISDKGESVITVDDLQMAQFLDLMINHEGIRQMIDTITSKAVLILGRFSDKRKRLLDALRDELRKKGYFAILFDFEKPASRDLTETISTLAHLSRFIIADVTDAKSIPQELQAIIPDLPSVPVRLLIQKGAKEYALIGHFKRYPWVIDTYEYADIPQLLASLTDQIIEPAEAKVEELKQK